MAEELIKITDLPSGTPLETDYIPYVDGVANQTKKSLKSELKGVQGDAATVDAGTTTTLAAGESATVTNVGTTAAAIFNFAIPQGIQGLTGADGACVESVAFVGNDMVFTLDDTSTATLTNAKTDLKGDTGLTGAKIVSASFVGDDLVFVLDDASTVTVTGAKTDLKGDTGATGETGATGKGITSITKTGTVGLVDTYTITYTDETTATFDVTNGGDGADGTNGTDGEDGISFIWKGAYVAETAYVPNDVVSYNGSTYICILASTGNLPTNATYWSLMAQKGADGIGSGDMLASVYDPTSVVGDAFDMDNMAQGDTNLFVSSTEKSTWNGKQDSLGFTPENVANKENTTLDTSTTKYPTNRLVKEYADGKVEDSITDGHTTIAPSGNAVFDALAGKQDAMTKATSSDIDTGTDDAKYVTSKAITDQTVLLKKSGGTMTGDLTIGDAKQIVLTAPSADVTCTGISTSAFNAGYTSTAVGDLVYLDSSATWQKVDADAIATSGGMLGIALEVKASGNACKVALPGSFVRVNSWNWTPGVTLYCSETAGAIATAIPTGADGVVRVIGWACNADYIYFYPSQDNSTVVA